MTFAKSLCIGLINNKRVKYVTRKKANCMQVAPTWQIDL